MKTIENIFAAQNVKYEKISRDDLQIYQEKWRKIYSRSLYKETGEWTLGNMDWHVFSFGHTPHLLGDSAWNTYRKRCGKFFLVLPNLDEGDGYYCESNMPLNLSMKGLDRYICPKDMSWTFVNTHEEDWIGPFYSDTEML